MFKDLSKKNSLQTLIAGKVQGKKGVELHPDKWKSAPAYSYFTKIMLNS